MTLSELSAIACPDVICAQATVAAAMKAAATLGLCESNLGQDRRRHRVCVTHAISKSEHVRKRSANTHTHVRRTTHTRKIYKDIFIKLSENYSAKRTTDNAITIYCRESKL